MKGGEKKKAVAKKKPRDLAREVGRLARAMEVQNNPGHRFLMGIVFGIGTAVGATILASFVLILFLRALQIFGIDASSVTQIIGN